MLRQPTAEQVDVFVQSRSTRPDWKGVPDQYRPQTRQEGYALQRAVYQRMNALGQRRIGYKIGCTAPASQAPHALDEPIYAGIFEHTRLSSLAEIRNMPLVAPAIECEIAFRMKRDLPSASADSEDAMLDAIDEVYASSEIVDRRYGVSPAELGVATLLADDFLHAAFVLGKPASLNLGRLRQPSALLTIDDRQFAKSVPGTMPPLNALRWLANKLEANGQRLRAGEIVMTGSILEPVSLPHPASTISIFVDGVGSL